jgi:hypothetical protein
MFRQRHFEAEICRDILWQRHVEAGISLGRDILRQRRFEAETCRDRDMLRQKHVSSPHFPNRHDGTYFTGGNKVNFLYAVPTLRTPGTVPPFRTSPNPAL